MNCSSSLTALELGESVLIWLVFHFLTWSTVSRLDLGAWWSDQSANNAERLKSGETRTSFCRHELFGVFWTAIYALWTAQAVLLWSCANTTDDDLVAWFWTHFALVIVNKAWTTVFFESDSPGWALAVLVLNIALQVADTALAALAPAGAGSNGAIVAYMALAVHGGWGLYALALNLEFVAADTGYQTFATWYAGKYHKD